MVDSTMKFCMGECGLTRGFIEKMQICFPSRHGPDFHRPQSQITIDSPDFHLRQSQNCLLGCATFCLYYYRYTKLNKDRKTGYGNVQHHLTGKQVENPQQPGPQVGNTNWIHIYPFSAQEKTTGQIFIIFCTCTHLMTK